MTPFRKTTLLTCLLLLSFSAFGQHFDSLKVTKAYQEASFDEILNDLSESYNFEVYFLEQALPSSTISISFIEEPLLKALNRLLENTSLGFLDYRTYLIVIAPNIIFMERIIFSTTS